MKYLILATLVALTGCASTSDLAALQSRVEIVENSSKVVANDVAELTEKVTKCELQVKKQHEDCVQHCKTIDSKLDNVFKKSQLK